MEKVCHCCKNLDPKETPWAGTWATGPVFEDITTKTRGSADLLAARNRGCTICSFLLEFALEYDSRESRELENIDIHVLAPSNRPMEVRISRVPKFGRKVPIGVVNIQVSRDCETRIPELPDLGKSLVLAPNAGDAKCFKFIKACLHQCSRRHSPHPISAKPLPKRVVDISAGSENVRIYEPHSILDHYVALSYCWGFGIQPVILSSQTIHEFKRCIPWNKLPKTLQDATEIVRHLGLKYLWVDVLCIIQDSTEDWEMESAKMGAYYKNSILTLAASSSWNAQSGIFNDRPTVSKPKRIQFISDNGQAYPVIAQVRPIRGWPSPTHDLGPLSQRGWTLQEHALSTRIVHCLESEIIWECSESMISEDGHPINNNTFSLIKQLTDPTFSAENAWRFLVRAYSARSLTNLNDKLPAISDIASYIHDRTGYKYVAGLWEETLSVDLAWSRPLRWTESGAPYWTSPRIGLLQAPSWSWASINANITFPMEHMDDLTDIAIHCRVEKVVCKSIGPNVHVNPHCGTLKISGPLQQAELFNAHEGLHVATKRDILLAMEEDSRFGPDRPPDGIQLFSLNTLGQELTFVQDTELEDLVARSGDSATWVTVDRDSWIHPVRPRCPAYRRTVWCLWCFTAKRSGQRELISGQSTQMYGVVLSKKSGDTDCYVRVGSVCTPHGTVPDGTPVETIDIE